jgi:hypothetical protein
MGSTLVCLTGKFQIFDVGLGRVVRTGYLAEHVLHFHSHELKVGDITFVKKDDSKSGQSKYDGPFRVVDINVEAGTVTLNSQDIVNCTQVRNNVISKPAYRKLAVIFLCNVWFSRLPVELIRKLAIRTGTLAAWDGSDDSSVHVYAGKYPVPFGPVRQKVLTNVTKGSAGPTARPVNQEAFDKAVKIIKQNAQDKRAAKKEKSSKKR